jgi:predicted outer membrane repeat protein
VHVAAPSADDDDAAASVTMLSTSFTSNSARSGGALFVHAEATLTNLVLGGCNFTSNVARGGAVQTPGGGAAYLGCAPVLRDCIFTNNIAIGIGADGGAILFDWVGQANTRSSRSSSRIRIRSSSLSSAGMRSVVATTNKRREALSRADYAKASLVPQEQESDVIESAVAVFPSVDFSSSVFVGNTAQRGGGALYWADSSTCPNASLLPVLSAGGGGSSNGSFGNTAAYGALASSGVFHCARACVLCCVCCMCVLYVILFSPSSVCFVLLFFVLLSFLSEIVLLCVCVCLSACLLACTLPNPRPTHAEASGKQRQRHGSHARDSHDCSGARGTV